MTPDPRVRQQLTAQAAENQRRGRGLASWVAELARVIAKTETDLAETFDRIAASGSRRACHLRTPGRRCPQVRRARARGGGALGGSRSDVAG